MTKIIITFCLARTYIVIKRLIIVRQGKNLVSLLKYRLVSMRFLGQHKMSYPKVSQMWILLSPIYQCVKNLVKTG